MMISCDSVSAMFRPALVATALALASPLAGGAQAPVPTPPAPSPAPQAPAPLPLGPARERGASITPAFEGWYQNADGTYTLLVGYFNRNSKETLEIPVGPNNRIEPGPVDQGQPTYFQTGRQWGVFAIKVPRDFGTKALTWTITSNGESQSIPLTLNKNYPIEPFEEKGMGNKPPVFTFSGATFTGPPAAVAADAHRHREAAGHAEFRRRRPEADQEGLRVGVQPQRSRHRHGVVPQVPRARHGELRAGPGVDQGPGRNGDHGGDLQPAGGVPGPGAGQRRIGRRRRRLPVLLDEHVRQGHGAVT